MGDTKFHYKFEDLKPVRASNIVGGLGPNDEYYPRQKVDAAICELDAKIGKLTDELSKTGEQIKRLADLAHVHNIGLAQKEELKVYRDPKEGPCWREFYEKSEVDKALAELKDEADKVIAELEAKNEKLEAELRALQNKMCEDVFEGISPSHITCPPLKYAACVNNRNHRNYYLALARAAETGRRFWAKEQVFAMREGRKKDSEKAWKMEKRRERQVKLFNAEAEKFKEGK